MCDDSFNDNNKELIMKTLSVVTLFCFVCYAAVAVLAYNDDKQVCQTHGYASNKITPSLEGFCIKQDVEDITIIVPVEKVAKFKKRQEKAKLLSWCVLRSSPVDC